MQRGIECYPNHASGSDILVLTEIHKSATTKNALESTQIQFCTFLSAQEWCLLLPPQQMEISDVCKIHVNHLSTHTHTHHTHAQFVLLLESMHVLYLTDSHFYWIDRSRLWAATLSLGSTKAALTDFPLRTAENRSVSLERCATAVQALPCETHPSDHSHSEDSLWKERKKHHLIVNVIFIKTVRAWRVAVIFLVLLFLLQLSQTQTLNKLHNSDQLK